MERREDSPPSASLSLARLIDEILETRWKASPVLATQEGVHGVDGELDRLDPGHLEDLRARAAGFLDRLRALPREDLTPPEALDVQILEAQLAWDLVEHDEVRSWEKHATLYPDVGLYGVYLLAVRDFAPLDERLVSIRSRLGEMPRLFAEGRANLRSPVRVATEMAIHVAQGGMDLLGRAIPALAEAVPRLRPEIETGCRRAAEAMEDFRRYLEDDLLARSDERFALGAALFDRKLRVYHGLPYTGEDLLEIAREERSAAERALEREADRVAPGEHWTQVVERLKGDHPSERELLDIYREQMAGARAFLVDRGIVTLPPGEEVEILETPPFDRPRTPYAAMIPPAAFEEDRQKSLFYVTLPAETEPAWERDERLKGHSLWGIPITAVHEAYPGHHLQFVHAHRCPSRVRRVYGTEVMVEGWALYCEEVMYEEGFYRDPRVRLFQLKDVLWRACRVFVDVGLHGGTMTREQAVDLLVEGAKLERPNAESEVNRYCLQPTQPMSYLVGRRMILELREAARRREGGAFSLQSFHDRLLACGSISPSLIRQAMGL